MPVVQLDIPQDLLDRLRKATPIEDDIKELVLAALEEWADWFDGSYRPMSVSELETQRIFAIYERVLKDELPSADRLGELFRLPMGRARYIIQVLAYRHGDLLQQRQEQAIVRAITEGCWSADRRHCVVTIDRSCQSIMDRIMGDLKANDKLTSIVRGTPVLHGVRYNLGARHREELLAFFDSASTPEQEGQ